MRCSARQKFAGSRWRNVVAVAAVVVINVAKSTLNEETLTFMAACFSKKFLCCSGVRRSRAGDMARSGDKNADWGRNANPLPLNRGGLHSIELQ